MIFFIYISNRNECSSYGPCFWFQLKIYLSLLALNSTPKQKKKKGVKITCSSPKSLNPKFNKNIREKSNYLCKLNLNPSYGESIIMMPLVGTLLGEGGGEVGQWTKQEEIRGVSCWPPNQGMKFWECERSLNIFKNTQSVHVACGLCLRLWAQRGFFLLTLSPLWTQKASF